jgi:hypothetical protein
MAALHNERQERNERFEPQDLLTILGVIVLGVIGYTFDQRLVTFRWLTGPLCMVWLVGYLAVPAACLYGAIRYRAHGAWWGVALALYLILMPVITMFGGALYDTLTGQDGR